MADRTYEPMPADRPHPCHGVNMAGVPVEWLTHDAEHGWELNTTDAYGEGTVVSITYCPWCGERLHRGEHEAALGESGRLNRGGIRAGG